MDLVTLAEYRRFEATTDAKGRPLVRANRKDLPHLTAAEREAYEAIVDPAGGWPMRVEQERIPLEAALAELEHTKA